MLEFIQLNISSIVVVLLFIIGLLFLYKRGKRELVRQVVLSLVIKAEKFIGSGTGELKYALVVENLYKSLPFTLTLLISKEEIDKYIEDAVLYMKEYLSKDKNLLSYDKENF